MNYYLLSAGLIGACVAVIHGALMERYMVAPLLASKSGLSPVVIRLVRPLLQFSTFGWFFGGIYLVFQALNEAKLSPASADLIWFVAAMYLYGAVFNFIGTRGKHPGGYLLLASVTLICLAF